MHGSSRTGRFETCRYGHPGARGLRSGRRVCGASDTMKPSARRFPLRSWRPPQGANGGWGLCGSGPWKPESALKGLGRYPRRHRGLLGGTSFAAASGVWWGSTGEIHEDDLEPCIDRRRGLAAGAVAATRSASATFRGHELAGGARLSLAQARRSHEARRVRSSIRSLRRNLGQWPSLLF